MEISKVMQEYLNRPKLQELINTNQFKKLFQDAISRFNIEQSNEVFNLLNIFRAAHIENIEQHIPAVIRVIDKIRNMDTSPGAFFKGTKEYQRYYGEYFGQSCEIINLGYYTEVKDIIDVKTDKEAFNKLSWDIEFDDYTILRDVPGKLLDIGNFLN